MTELIHSIEKWQALRHTFHPHDSVGFVPTMGNLHQGHASLLSLAKVQNNISVLSIFVNPTQFNDPQDLQKYPRTLEDDLKMATALGIDYVICPHADELYPDDYHYQVHETTISHLLEGVSRPGHFTGMLTVVLKLLLLVKATRAYFGEKDYQQLQLVKGMVKAFFIETEIIACPTIRETTALAMSSRNRRLNEAERTLADCFAKGMLQCQSTDSLKDFLQQHNIPFDYVEIWQNRLLAAVQIGNIRLIDNVEIS
ncbi:pantoate--beta-alanine ligase [Candidatus Berkiella aquae]|uniref:Pantothenate synthetase n=1 Tax=Candidatus Berkiella aquae TaxID=295108 RepID=A0A0Q9YKA0_9GAMM|nr:pantoate--beta-alanine ligase [Candidatus Berkiella aquae]MCS5711229.1 pantoate--beta-alanine ligase [Candidatus Berkiella aquae]